ncbi:MAG: hypothetical protein KDD66_10550 [Bdellovibrionales bacterium]|nr:hypothetical protein [Bdellovibrionales bacterium]
MIKKVLGACALVLLTGGSASALQAAGSDLTLDEAIEICNNLPGIGTRIACRESVRAMFRLKDIYDNNPHTNLCELLTPYDRNGDGLDRGELSNFLQETLGMSAVARKALLDRLMKLLEEELGKGNNLTCDDMCEFFLTDFMKNLEKLIRENTTPALIPFVNELLERVKHEEADRCWKQGYYNRPHDPKANCETTPSGQTNFGGGGIEDECSVDFF